MLAYEWTASAKESFPMGSRTYTFVVSWPDDVNEQTAWLATIGRLYESAASRAEAFAQVFCVSETDAESAVSKYSHVPNKKRAPGARISMTPETQSNAGIAEVSSVYPLLVNSWYSLALSA